MADDNEHDGNNGLGRMVAGLKATVEAFQTNWQEQDRRASEGRKELYNKVESFGLSVVELGHRLNTVAAEVAEMKPAVRDWVNTKNRAEGAVSSTRVLWGLAGAFVVVVGWVFDHFLSIIPHVK